MKRVLVLVLAISTLAAARDKKAKPHPGPYVFTSKSSAQTLKALIVQQNLSEGYTLDSDNQFQFRFSKPAQMPSIDAIFMASSVCKGMTTKKVWSYALAELNGTTKVTVQPVWEYPDDYCQTQTQEFIWSRPEEIAAFQAMLDKAPTASTQAPTATPAPTPVAYQQQAEPAKQSTAQPISPDESSGDAARRAKQHAACLELAKDNPSITCK
ncbi:MAG: hypothetical protein ABSF85_10710 [Terriglobales bacterium]|jgi:hypothetical protein